MFARAAAKTSINSAKLPSIQDAARLSSLWSYQQVEELVFDVNSYGINFVYTAMVGNREETFRLGVVRSFQGFTTKKTEKRCSAFIPLELILCSCKISYNNACEVRKAGLSCPSVWANCSGHSCENVPD